MNANAEVDAAGIDHVIVALSHFGLDGNRAGYGVDYARKLDQRPVAHQFDDAPVIVGDLWIDQLLPVRLERSQSARLVPLHETAVANHVGSEDGRESAFHARYPC